MEKKIITIILVIPIVLTILIFSVYYSSNEEIHSENIQTDLYVPDVIMPTKVSRPGCEITDSCYVPSKISIKLGEQVVWQNQDSAFHSVTSGTYGDPDGLFDSGYLDPDQIFTYQFEEIGNFDYYCTLHPWMEGIVVVN